MVDGIFTPFKDFPVETVNPTVPESFSPNNPLYTFIESMEMPKALLTYRLLYPKFSVLL